MLPDSSTSKSGFDVIGILYVYCTHSGAKKQTFKFGWEENLNITSVSCQHIDYIFKAANIWVEHKFFLDIY